MTYRERRLARAERLREWAEGREAKAEAAFRRSDEIADQIPLGQPILSGHHSERRHRRDLKRINSGMSAGIENSRKAADFRRRADSIEAAASSSIYADDHDAAESLEARIVEREQSRDAMKRANAESRKGGDWRDGLDAQLLVEAEKNFRFWPGGTDIPFPNVKNVTAAIRRDRKRLEGMSR